jgi:phage repressor protein C with HTH and peptisase S24 domain
MAARLDDAIARNGGRAVIAERTGIPVTSIDRYCRNQSEPPSTRLGILARACGVSTDFLIFGESAPAQMMMTQEMSSEMQNVAMIPLLDVIASAGPGIENNLPYEIEKLPFPRSWLRKIGLAEEHARFLDSRGDSMEPTIPDGAITLVDIRFQGQARKNGIYVVVDGNNVRIKRIAIGWQGAIQLLSDNERYQMEQLAPPDAEALVVAGKVVWAGGEL